MVENKSFREEATQVTMVSIVGNFLLSAFKLFAYRAKYARVFEAALDNKLFPNVNRCRWGDVEMEEYCLLHEIDEISG